MITIRKPNWFLRLSNQFNCVIAVVIMQLLFMKDCFVCIPFSQRSGFHQRYSCWTLSMRRFLTARRFFLHHGVIQQPRNKTNWMKKYGNFSSHLWAGAVQPCIRRYWRMLLLESRKVSVPVLMKLYVSSWGFGIFC